MATTPTTYLRGKTGTLTIGSTDVGHCKVVEWGREGESMRHIDASDGEGGTDRILNTALSVKIKATIEQFSPTIMAILWGGGTATAGSFAVDFNDTEYAVTWAFALETDDPTYSTLTFYHTKCIITPASTLAMAQGDWAGIPIEIEVLKSSSATAPYGYWFFTA